MSKFWRNRKVLVTGGTGLLGSWLIKRLLDMGAEVICLSLEEFPNSNWERLGLRNKIIAAKGDIQEYSFIRKILSKYEIQTVFHLAAQTLVTVANQDPIPTFKTNILGTWNVLEACRNCSTVKQVIISSSDKVYGEKKDLPCKEDDPLRGAHPYDVSKSCADLISQSYNATYRLPVCVTRCANLYGGGDLNFSRIVPGTIRSAFYNQRPVIRSDGKYLRDYFYVEDAVEAVMVLAEKMQDKSIHGEAFNFSSGIHLNVQEIVGKILKIMGKKLKPNILNEAKHEIRDQYLSINKAKRLLSWKPGYTLDQGLKKTVDWYIKYLETSDGL